MREPQCEGVKRFSPVSNIERKSMCSLTPQTAMYGPIARGRTGSVGVQERGERTRVVQAYLGDLAVSAVAGSKVKRSLVNGARLTDCQKSDQLIVAMKPVKAGGAKGLTNQQSPKAKHAWHRRSSKAWNMN